MHLLKMMLLSLLILYTILLDSKYLFQILRNWQTYYTNNIHMFGLSSFCSVHIACCQMTCQLSVMESWVFLYFLNSSRWLDFKKKYFQIQSILLLFFICNYVAGFFILTLSWINKYTYTKLSLPLNHDSAISLLYTMEYDSNFTFTQTRL